MVTNHKKLSSQATKYRKIKSLKKDLNSRIKKKVDPPKVFGVEEEKKLVEDCEGSMRDILRVVKWMRHCFGKNSFTPHNKHIIKERLSRFDDLIEAEKMTFKSKNGEDIESVLSKVVYINSFIEEACKERGIKIPFMEGSVDNCIVAAVLLDKDDAEEELIEKYKATGSKRVLLLAKVAGVPETR